MAFGQTSGPPASGQQLAALAELLRAAGYEDFREARHPLGLTQRQSNGKFTRSEAAALIDLLEAAAEAKAADAETGADHGGTGEAGVVPAPAPRRAVDATSPRPRSPSSSRRRTVASQPEPDLSEVSAEALVEELGRRGWICSPPP